MFPSLNQSSHEYTKSVFLTCMTSIKVAKDVSRVGYHEVSLWNLKVSLDVFLLHAVKCCSTCQLFFLSDFVHLQLRNRSAKCEDPKNARVLLLLVRDVHVVHRPTNLDFLLSVKITQKGGMPTLVYTLK